MWSLGLQLPVRSGGAPEAVLLILPATGWFLVDEAHNLPDRARAMYSARFCKSSLDRGKTRIGQSGKSALKTALTKADKALLEARKAQLQLAPRHSSQTDAADPAQTSLFA